MWELCMFSLKVGILLLLISVKAFACAEEIWSIEGQKTAFCYDDKVKTILSVSCVEKNCGARELMKNSLEMKVESSQKGKSRNPGSIYCQRLLGKVFIGKNERGSENAFCRASDGTFINLSSLGNR